MFPKSTSCLIGKIFFYQKKNVFIRLIKNVNIFFTF